MNTRDYRKYGMCRQACTNNWKKEKIVKSEPGFPVLGQAVPAVDRSSFCRLEGDFTLFTTV